MKASPEWELVGIVEGSPEVAARYEQLGIRLLKREAILTDMTLPVVAVESAVKDHEKDALDVLRANKHVHIEKPIAHTRRYERNRGRGAES